MQVSADVVDWSWLSSIADSDRLVDELFEGADREEIVESCYAFNPRWNDSATMYFDVALAMKELLAREGSAFRSHVEKGIYPLISENQATDELGLSGKTEGCYYASLSPVAVVSTGDVFRDLDLSGFVGKLVRASSPSFLDELWVSDKETYLKEYFWQWQEVLDRAQARGWGILGHIG